MQNIGFLNLPTWKERLQEIFVSLNRNDLLKLPLLGRENSDNAWSAFDKDEFFSLVQTGILFESKTVKELPQRIITSDIFTAVSRLKAGLYRDTFFSAAIGSTFPFLNIITDTCSVSKPQTFLVQNDAFAGFVLSTMEAEGKPMSEAVCDARWKGINIDNSSYSLHGIVSLNRLVLQIAEIFGCFAAPEKIPAAGINNLELVDVVIGKELNMSIRLLGIAKYDDNLKAICEPCLIPERYFLAQARGGSEFLYVKTDDNQSQIYGCPGTSPETVVRGIVNDMSLVSMGSKPELKVIEKVDEFENRFYLRFTVTNLTDTLSELLKQLTEADIEIEKIYQPQKLESNSDEISIVLFTKKTKKTKLTIALDRISDLLKLASLKTVLRIIDR